MKPGLEK